MVSAAVVNDEKTGTPLGEPAAAWTLTEFDEQASARAELVANANA